MPFYVPCIRCPECGKLGPIDLPHKRTSMGIETIIFTCMHCKYAVRQSRPIPSFPAPRDNPFQKFNRPYKPPLTKEERELIVKKYSEGAPMKAITDILHIAPRTAYRILVQEGIPFKKKSPGRPAKDSPPAAEALSPSVPSSPA